ncbi:MAG: M23 family metallopeptidase [Clostridiales bacterium]|nr:M23 family metallopeptidase [Clostridiales bacterium]
MSDNKRSRRGGQGYYIALILCAAAIGITGYVYYRNANQAEPVSLEETVGEVPALIEDEVDVPVIATQPAPKATKPAATEATTTAPTEKKPMKTMSPVSGDSIFGYSMEALSYNQTTRDWRVHNGVDLAAEAGAEVKAAADGEVYTVFEDDAMGTTVVIRHADGYTTKYASLAENVSVKPGDTVTMGQVIGYASDTALVESTLGTHVHFGVTCNDAPVDPAEFLAMGS